MIKIQFSSQEELVLPESLGRSLGLHEGDHVEVRRQDDVVCLRRWDPTHLPGPLTDLARIITSSQPPGSVDVESYMNKRGYEQVDERPDPRV